MKVNILTFYEIMSYKFDLSQLKGKVKNDVILKSQNLYFSYNFDFLYINNVLNSDLPLLLFIMTNFSSLYLLYFLEKMNWQKRASLTVSSTHNLHQQNQVRQS